MSHLFHPGLVSVTFRKLSPRDIIDLVVQAGLRGLEWGGDVHVPHGEIAQAKAVQQMTLDAGLTVAAYGSYYRLSHSDTGPFEVVLETAVALGAPAIRVWAGRQGTDAADEATWQAVIADSRRIADLAAAVGITIVYEYHANTLTDTPQAARKLLETVAHPNLKSYWQPPRYSKRDDNLNALETVAPWVYGLHLFSWHQQTGERLPLIDGAADWAQYLSRAAALNREMYTLLEFVVDDSPEQFLQDAATLQAWLNKQG
jgi:sugar phosphate isomerase/epimerase